MIITLFVLLFSVFTTFKITNYLGLELDFRSLLLCALCASLITFTLPLITAPLANYHFILALGITLLSASFITSYNERLIAHTILNQSGEFLPENQPQALIAAQPLALHQPYHGTVAPLLTSKAVQVTAILDPITPLEKAPLSKLAVTAETRKSQEKKPSLLLPALLLPTIIDVVRKDMENAKLLKLTAVLAKLNSLDSLLDYAYEQKNRNAYENSIFAFKQALERYGDDAYAPFIVIEMGNIYKNTGLYDEAIIIYNRAFHLPAVMEQPAIKEEFHNTITYLRIVKTILLKYNCLKIHFAKIPKVIMQEIENEFDHWRTQKYEPQNLGGTSHEKNCTYFRITNHKHYRRQRTWH